MSINWSTRPHSKGCIYEARSPSDEWMITWPDSEACVELRYGRKRQVDEVATHVMPIGRFSSVAEAMLAVDLLTEISGVDNVAGALDELGFTPWFEGASMLMVKHGKTTKGRFLYMTDIGGGNLETGLAYDGPSKRQEFSIAQMWTTTNEQQFQPLDIKDLRAVERAIMLELLTFRMSRAPGSQGQPMTMDELDIWRQARHAKVSVDPSGEVAEFQP